MKIVLEPDLVYKILQELKKTNNKELIKQVEEIVFKYQKNLTRIKAMLEYDKNTESKL